MSGLRLVTPPPVEPVTLEEAKGQLRVTGTDDDYQIQTLITAAREWAEGFTHRRFITQTWDWTLDEFPEDNAPLAVPYGMLQSVTSFSYLDSAGDSQSLDGSPTEYFADIASDPGRIYLANGGSWPTLQGIENGVTVRFTAGYGLAAAVPRIIKLPIFLYMEALYDKDERTMRMIMNAAENLLLPHRIFTIV